MNFSLRTLLLFTAAVAVVCASLVYATPVVGDLFYTLGLLTIPVAAIAAYYRRGPSRAYWIGFLVLFAAYFCHAAWPIEVRTVWWVAVSQEFNFRSPGLLTTRGLSLCFQGLHGSLPSGRLFGRPSPDELAVHVQYLSFMAIGHTAIATLLGICGGALARRLSVDAMPVIVGSNERDSG